MSNVKLHINISQGIIDAEGSEEFVWRVYEDFRGVVSSARDAALDVPLGEVESSEGVVSANSASTDERPRKRSVKRRSLPASGASGSTKERFVGMTSYKPRILSDLDTAGLKEFLAEYKLGNNQDTIVVLTRFLETKGVVPASLDAFFTCYRDAGMKLPEAFGQAFVDLKNKKGFIEFTGPADIKLTIRGINHLEHGGVKKADV